MSKINSYPKVLTLGHQRNYDVLNGHVIVEEKIDGSQFSFGLKDGELFCKSKNRVIDMANPPKMFKSAVLTVSKLDILPYGYTYRGEVLDRPKHNTLAYDRVPRGNIIIFDIMRQGDEDYLNRDEKELECRALGLEFVPLLFEGHVTDGFDFSKFLDMESVLGGQKIEGVVIKNYNKFNRDNKPMFCKIVRDDFKEKNGANHKKIPTNDIVSSIGMSYNTDARWNKAVQSLRESGQLHNASKDIGNIIRVVMQDVEAECKDEIADMLFKHFKKNILGHAVKGIPEWYNAQID